VIPRDAVRLCAELGLTATEAATVLGCARGSACAIARETGATFAKARAGRWGRLGLMSRQERADYELALRKGLPRGEALEVAGRGDLVRARR